MRNTLVTILALGFAGAAQADEPLVAFGAVNITDVLANTQGGLSRQTRILDKLDLTATYTGDDHGQPGLSLFLDLQATDATNLSGAVVGDAQTVSNIDAPAGARVANAWIAQDFDGIAAIKGGIIDLNTEFDVHNAGALFLNSAHGIGPDFSQAGANGPSIFPTTGLGVAGWWIPGDHWQIKAGLFEGTVGNPGHPGRTDISFSDDEGVLLALEVRNHLTPDFVIGAGVWHYTASFDALDPMRSDRITGNSGFYAMADGLLFKEADSEKSGLSGWLRLGFADRRVNPIDATLGGGLVYTGPFGRDTDQAGLSVAHAHFDDAARNAALGDGVLLGDAETAIEATYSLALGEHLILQPDLQYVMSPGADQTLPDALVAGSRIILTW